jgi:hypothetical protein
MNLFIPAADMTPDEQQSFRDWARANYVPFEPISGIWHPIVQNECTLINQEAKLAVGPD